MPEAQKLSIKDASSPQTQENLSLPKVGDRVTEIRTTVGVQIGSVVLTSLIEDKHSSKMFLADSSGAVLVFFRTGDGTPRKVLVPAANISFAGLA